MFASKVRVAVIAAASSLALAGCVSPYGMGVGYGTDGYYGGYGNYGGYGSYGGYGPYGANPYGGWYDNYYYPGSGYYVYDQYGRSYPWTSAQREHWENHRRNVGTMRSVSGPISGVLKDAVKNDSGGTTTTTPATADAPARSQSAPSRIERRVRTNDSERRTVNERQRSFGRPMAVPSDGPRERRSSTRRQRPSQSDE